MSVIQTIREKGAVIVIAVIALSLIAFILMDSRSGTGKLFGGGNTTTIGVVNGDKIEIGDFNDRVKEMEQQYGNNASSQSDQIRKSVWDQMVAEKIITDQFNDLGLAFTPREMSSIMFSDDAPQIMKQTFVDKQTGQYDIAQAQQWWEQLKGSKNEEQKKEVASQVIDPMRLNALYTKYTSMIAASIYIPKWLSKEQEEESDKFAKISYVAIPYTTISDSSIQVSDDEIHDYLEKNKNKYKQEPGRMISYVSFSIAPSSKDSAAIKQSLVEMKSSFAADSNATSFLARNSSAINYDDIYVPKSKILGTYKDSLINLPNGDVFGPYIDGKNYVLAKKIGMKILPDSIKCRHILIGTSDPQTGQPTMPDSTARKLADSIATAIKNGANFDSLETKYSTDKEAHKDKGVMNFDITTIQSSNFAKPFGDFLMNDKGETKKVVKTQFGYHYIEILDKKNPEPAYNIAYMAKEIAPSDETINDANSEAIKLSGQARTKAAFEKYVSQNGLKEISDPTPVKENDFQIGRLQDARQIVRWAYQASSGDVSEPFALKDQFVVAVVDKILQEGLPDAETARSMVEPLIRNIKKADIIDKKLDNPTTLEAAAKAFNLQVLNTGSDSTLTFDARIINGIGSEPRVAGAAFDKTFLAKVSPPIPGNTGVFVIKVDSILSKTLPTPDMLKQEKTIQLSQASQDALGQSFESLRKIADIKDYRSKFF
jgi:peptidyl-prolyl cis-trans isomerase D